MSKKITKKRTVRELLAICEQYPNLRNPVDEEIGDCTYFTFAVQPGQSQRCLIGEWLSRKGYDVQEFCDNAVDVLNALKREQGLAVTDEALRVAQALQVYADAGGEPRNWDQVGRWIRTQYGEYV